MLVSKISVSNHRLINNKQRGDDMKKKKLKKIIIRELKGEKKYNDYMNMTIGQMHDFAVDLADTIKKKWKK